MLERVSRGCSNIGSRRGTGFLAASTAEVGWRTYLERQRLEAVDRPEIDGVFRDYAATRETNLFAVESQNKFMPSWI